MSQKEKPALAGSSLAGEEGFVYTHGVRWRSRPFAQTAVWPVGQTLRIPHAQCTGTVLSSDNKKARLRGRVRSDT
jgi:hypothetical protein